MISVIVPTFNSGKTIGKCLESLTNQDYELKPDYPMPGATVMVGYDLRF